MPEPMRTNAGIAQEIACHHKENMIHKNAEGLAFDIETALLAKDTKLTTLTSALRMAEEALEVILKNPKHDETDAPYTKVICHDDDYARFQECLTKIREVLR